MSDLREINAKLRKRARKESGQEEICGIIRAIRQPVADAVCVSLPDHEGKHRSISGREWADGQIINPSHMQVLDWIRGYE